MSDVPDQADIDWSRDLLDVVDGTVYTDDNDDVIGDPDNPGDGKSE